MKQGRILILGQSKESSFEIRTLLEDPRFELEIALNKDIGKMVLASRRMSLLVMHTELVGTESAEFFEYLANEGIEIPVMLVGDDASGLEQHILGQPTVKSFDKPYPADEVRSYIEAL